MTAVGGRGFPHIALLDADGEVLGEPRGRTVGDFTAALREISRVREILAKEALTKAERVELYLLETGLGRLDVLEAEERMEALGKLEGEAAKRVLGAYADVEYEDYMRNPPRNDDERAYVGRGFAEMAAEGRVPANRKYLPNFWRFQVLAAREESDVAAFERALRGLRSVAGEDEEVKKALPALEAELKKLRS
jgi:hypothetical protein